MEALATPQRRPAQVNPECPPEFRSAAAIRVPARSFRETIPHLPITRQQTPTATTLPQETRVTVNLRTRRLPTGLREAQAGKCLAAAPSWEWPAPAKIKP